MNRAHVVSAAAALAALVGFGEVVVDDRLPAGNIVFEKIEGDTVAVHQDLRDTSGDWFYWAMRVTGAAGRTLTFKFTQSEAVGVRGAVVTTDGGASYGYAGTGVTRNQFTYAFGADENETWFYECIPYMPENWSAFLAQHEAKRGTWFETGVLCPSTTKRIDVPKARFGCLTGTPKYKLLLTSRHHCSEAVASYVLEGLVAAFLKEDELGAWLRENVLCEAVPFVDYDGSVAGDQGKNRTPHDHNRDYTEFLFTETKAVSELASALQPDVWFDIHCPWLYGGCNEYLYTPGKRTDLPNSHPENEALFSQILETKVSSEALPYSASNDIPFGEGWNTGANYDKGLSSVYWALNYLGSVKLCRTFEVPFANASGTVVTEPRLRTLGGDIAKAFKAFLLEMEDQAARDGGDDGAVTDLDALPEAYTRLQYVQSTHQQCVDTRYVPNAKTKIVATFSVDEYNEGTNYKGAYVFGCYGGSNAGRCQFRYGKPLFVGWGGSYDNANLNQFAVDAEKHTVVFDKGSVSIDGGTACYSANWSGTSTSLWLFSSNPNGGALNTGLCSAIRLYSLVISEDGVEKRHYIPAKDGDGRVGLYDTVGESLYVSKTETALEEPSSFGIPTLAGFEVGGSYANGAWAKVSVESDDTVNTTVDCYVGTDPSSWTSIRSWRHQETSAIYAATNAPVAYGDRHYAAFKVTYRQDGETREMWTATNSVEITGKVDWKGRAGETWSVADNWDPKFVPNGGLSAYFSDKALVTAGDDALTARAIVVQSGVAAMSFTPETHLDFTYLHIGNSGTAKLAVTNGVLVSTQGIDFPKSNSALVLAGTQATFAGLLNLDHSETQVVLRDQASLAVKGVTGVVGGGSVKVSRGSSLCATGEEGIVVMNNETLTVDGGSVTNNGILSVGALNASESWKGSNDTPGVLKIVNGGSFVQRHGSIHLAQCRSAEIYVTDGSRFDATGYGIYFPNTTDALKDAAAADSFFDVTNSTVLGKSMNIGYHPLRRKNYTLRLIGEDAKLETEADIRLGAGWGGGNNDRNIGSSNLVVDDATVKAGGALLLGTQYEGTATERLEIAGASARVEASEMDCRYGNPTLSFIVPKKGFRHDAVISTTGRIRLGSTRPTPIAIDATACTTGAWQTLLAAGEITNLTLDQVQVSDPEGRNHDLRLLKDSEDKVTALQFRLKAKGLVVLVK